MKVYAIRHGIADAHAATDFDRRLTAEGREKFQASVRGLERLGVQLDQVFHSPLLRAVETAELLEPVLDGPLTVLDALADPPDERLYHALERAPERVALVGHEPWLSQFVAWLTCGERRLGPAVHLSKGTVVKLSLLLAGAVAVYIAALQTLAFQEIFSVFGRSLRLTAFEPATIVTLAVIIHLSWRGPLWITAAVSVGWTIVLSLVFQLVFRIPLPGTF